MKNLLLVLITGILILVACSSPTISTKEVKDTHTTNNTIVPQESMSAGSALPSPVKLVKEIDCPEEEFRVTIGSFFKAYCQPLCDEEKGKLLDYQKTEKYGKGTPYNLTFSIKNDSAIIQFDIIYDCCLDFICSVSKNKNLLSLSHDQPINISCPCDCYCDYKMVYEIKNQNMRLDSVLIKGKLYPLTGL